MQIVGFPMRRLIWRQVDSFLYLHIYLLTLDYESNPGFLGCICGRVANRIDGATFELDGTRYNVSKNDPLGNNMCHGGFKGFSRVRIME